MELRELNTFIHVAKLKSFSRAAEQLGYTQAAVTIQIKNLEKELDVHLFDRIGKQTTLTHQGEILYDYAITIINDVEQAAAAVSASEEPNGQLTIGTIESMCSSVFPELIRKYHEKYPKVKITILTDTPEELLAMMDKNVIDLVFFIDKPVYSPKWIKVLEEPEDVYFVASADHRLAKKKSVKLEQILMEPFISTEEDASYRLLLGEKLASIGKEIHPFLETGNTEFILDQLRHNCGISFLPDYVVRQDLEEKRLVRMQVKDLESEGHSLRVWRQIAYHKDKWVTKEMETFLDAAIEMSKEKVTVNR